MSTKPTIETGRQRGFTIIEVVITIVVSSIIAVGIVNYIGDSVEGFAASGNRNKLASSGRTVVDRIALELHNAVPNSIRVTTAQPGGDQCLEFMPFTGASSYRDAPFTGSGDDTFEAVDFNPTLTYTSPAEVYAVIYPISTAALYEFDNPGPMALIDELEDTGGADGVVTVRLDATHRFTRRSPVDRFYVARSPVSFCLVGDRLFRYQDYGVQEIQCTPSTPSCLEATAPDRILISDSLDNSGRTAFNVLEPTLRRNAIIAMDLSFTSEGDVVNLKHEVLMRNVP
ncbi:prepilin-type N-terminal cleavage/methylation domain-containing protein [Pseudohongiella acticola]|uniref:prepilin-type N-terminal cleavage/methylation domain-containing protein n=1 Tax=Pseudohongiella acticola TaxID=1524254 RepID=UPI0030EDCBD6